MVYDVLPSNQRVHPTVQDWQVMKLIEPTGIYSCGLSCLHFPFRRVTRARS